MIDANRAFELLEAAVELRGRDYSIDDSGCQYVRDQEPHCLIGVALWIEGATLSQLSPDESMNICGFGGRADLMNEFSVTNDARDIFCVAQSKQDISIPWGLALDQTKARWADELRARP